MSQCLNRAFIRSHLWRNLSVGLALSVTASVSGQTVAPATQPADQVLATPGATTKPSVGSSRKLSIGSMGTTTQPSGGRNDYTNMSIEDLMNVEVISCSKEKCNFSNAAMTSTVGTRVIARSSVTDFLLMMDGRSVHSSISCGVYWNTVVRDNDLR